MNVRVGMGFDVHRFSGDPERRLILGGISLDGPGLDGHSDADVITHAVADALLGASGLDDLGTLFPAGDRTLAGADSVALLASVVQLVVPIAQIGNVDCTVVAEAPRLGPHRAAMQTRLSEVVGAPVTIKPKRAEQLGSLGRQEGIAAWAVALVTLR